MSIETLLFVTLKDLVSNRVWPGVAPDGTSSTAYITWQTTGGEAVNFVDGSQPSKENIRLQINVWASTIIEAKRVAQQAETALRVARPLSTTVLTGQFTRYDAETKRHGTYQFFSCWADIAT